MDEFYTLRKELVEKYIIPRGIKDKRVINAMLSVPRELFVPEYSRKFAYEDRPLPLFDGQTISQPYIVALMTSLLELPQKNSDTIVLEIGTGSGYQAAILAAMGCRVETVERISRLAGFAEENLKKASLKDKIHIHIGDGSSGLPELAPYDGIIVTAAPPDVPEPLKNQLKIGANLVMPVGRRFFQELLRIKRISEDEFETESFGECAFVPLIGKHAF